MSRLRSIAAARAPRALFAIALLAAAADAVAAAERPAPTKDPQTMTIAELEAAGLCPVKRVPSKLIYHVTFGDTTYHLCCRSCRKAFAEDPGAYGVPGHKPKPKAAPTTPAPAAPRSKDEQWFVDTVLPILDRACFQCHGAEKQRGGLRMDALAHLLKGGDNGPVAAPGDPEASKMVAAVRWSDPETRMPPKQKLTDAEIEALARWVQLGMPWPAGAAPKR